MDGWIPAVLYIYIYMDFPPYTRAIVFSSLLPNFLHALPVLSSFPALPPSSLPPPYLSVQTYSRDKEHLLFI